MPRNAEAQVRELRTADTADLRDGSAAAIRELLDEAFGKVSEDTYQHVLGGVHALLAEDGALIGHASVGGPGRCGNSPLSRTRWFALDTVLG